ncbi:MAG: peroxidase [FCB group bacterium]|nr:peroxidase [FCB group bacterium]
MQHHRAGLVHRLTQRKMPVNKIDRLVSALETNYKTADFDDRLRAMLDYTDKLTLNPQKICKADVDSLRTQDFNDRAIHDICAITAYFAFVNRMADGLGVEMEHETPA